MVSEYNPGTARYLNRLIEDLHRLPGVGRKSVHDGSPITRRAVVCYACPNPMGGVIMAEQFRFCYTPEYVRSYVPEGKEEAVEQFYRENPSVAHLELLERPPSWTSVLPEVEEKIRGRKAD